MKLFNPAALLVVATCMASIAFSQDAPPTPPPAPPRGQHQKQEEIIIRKKDGNTEKMTIVVDGDNVTVNGKPIDEMKDGNVTIIKRKQRMGGDAPEVRAFKMPHGGNMNMEEMGDGGDFDIDMFSAGGVNKAMLGVMTDKTDNGVKVTDITKESGAEKAGLKKDDIITKVGGANVASPKELTEAIAKYKPNDQVEVTYQRGGKENKATATLTENKMKTKKFSMNLGDMDFDFPEGAMPPVLERMGMRGKPRLGMQVQDLEEGKGVKVKDVDDESPAAKAGIKEGDVITQVNGKNINGVEELRTETNELKEGETIKLNYTRSGKSQSADLKLPKKLKTADL